MEKKLVLVVHGIGEQSAGETTDLLLGGLDNNGRFLQENSVRQLREMDESTSIAERKYKLFPCHMRRTKFESSETVFAEVYWADLSRGRVGRLSTLAELFQTILGLGHLVRENAASYFPDGHVSRKLANYIVALLHGPIAVTNLLLLAAFLLVSFLKEFLDLELHEVVHWGVGITGIISVIGGLVWGGRVLSGKLRHKGSYLMQISCDFNVFAGALLALLAIYAYVFLPSNSQLISALPLWIANDPEFNACAGEAGRCQIAWYGIIIGALMGFFWVIIYGFSVWILLSVAWHKLTSKTACDYPLFPAIISAMVLFWAIVVISIWVGLLKGSSALFKSIEVTKEDIEVMAGILTPSIFLLFGLLALVLGLWLIRQKRASSSGIKNYQNALKPRLILNKWLNFFLMSVLALLSVYAALVLLTKVGPKTEIGKLAIHVIECIDDFYPLATGISVALAAIYSFSFGIVATGLGIIKDIVTYFNGSPSKKDPTHYIYPHRERIHHRFEIVLKTLLQSEKPSELVIISHSQGTVIAVESLRDQSIVSLIEAHVGKNTSLFTMGSPVTHIYTKYFWKDFPVPEGLDKFLKSWSNIFRLDDFVGTTIDGKSKEWPINIPVNAGGHTAYWIDGEVRAHLVGTVLTEFKS